MNSIFIKDTFKDTAEVWTQDGLERVYVTYHGKKAKETPACMSFTVKQAKRLRKALKTAILGIEERTSED